ncbi:RHS repeat-associated core domain-containing protein [Pseudomonas fragariae (ex Marin et al. 2024)]|uniref:RHS repeat-associated core domain-containing protein n=1 Tax=Pseudomonas fragariae (ex Marin et al. 2024) TaxID=3080056 RepID=UPI003F7A974B
MAILCRYTYDPLDRVSTLTPLAQAVFNRFYNGEQLMTELQGGRQRTCVRAGGQLLAQQLREGDEVVTTMIAGDRNNSVLHASEAGQQSDFVYTPFGHHQAVQASAELPGFNGEQPDPLTGHYLLGNGYRAYNPVLMRFNSPDSMSPFGKGGLNAYAYCVGDPVNRVDPTGHEHEELFVGIGLALLGVVTGGVGLAVAPLRNAAAQGSAIGILMGVAAAAAGVPAGLLLESNPETSSALQYAAIGMGGLSVLSGTVFMGRGLMRNRRYGSLWRDRREPVDLGPTTYTDRLPTYDQAMELPNAPPPAYVEAPPPTYAEAIELAEFPSRPGNSSVRSNSASPELHVISTNAARIRGSAGSVRESAV